MVGPYGAITWWGFSPALDFQQEYKKLENAKDSSSTKIEALNILCIGSGDCRHLLTTIAKTYKWPKRQINVYVVENNIELYLRHLLLLGIALEPRDKLGLQEKCELFLELFGNSLIRPQTSEYLQEKSNHFIKLVTDLDYMRKMFPLVDLSSLKFKERDMMEGVLKFWRNTEPKLFDITKCWDMRLRNHLEVRYDHRFNIFDWDYNMVLHDKAPIIRFRDYKMWRDQGVAFDLRDDCSYEVSNRSLSSGIIVKKGDETYGSRGYWGDIVNSPFLAFGIECKEKSYFEKKNDTYVHNARDISQYNVTSLMHEVMTGEKYSAPKTKDNKEHSRITEIIEEVEELGINDGDDKSYCPKTIEDFSIHFLPLNSLPDITKKEKYKKIFDLIYFSNSMVHLLTPEVSEILRDEAMVLVETTKFMLELKDEQHKEYLKKITGMAERTGCQLLNEVDPIKDSFAIFKTVKQE